MGLRFNSSFFLHYLQGGALCRFTFNPELPQEVTSGCATFENLGTVQLERVSNGLFGTKQTIPGL